MNRIADAMRTLAVISGTATVMTYMRPVGVLISTHRDAVGYIIPIIFIAMAVTVFMGIHGYLNRSRPLALVALIYILGLFGTAGAINTVMRYVQPGDTLTTLVVIVGPYITYAAASLYAFLKVRGRAAGS